MRETAQERWTALWWRLRAWVGRGRVRQEVDRELDYHLEMRARDLEAAGLDPRRARAEAHARFGDFHRIRAECHALQMVEPRRQGDNIMSEFLYDLRHALRGFRKQPAFSAVVVLTIALGIGANTAIFSIVDGVLLQPLPFDQPDRLYRLWQADRLNGTRFENFSYPDYVDVEERNRVFEGMATTSVASMTLTSADAEPALLTIGRATATYWDLLGVPPILGRGFRPEETVPGGPGVAVISHDTWTSRFGSDPSVLERSLTLDGNPYRIVGVLGPDPTNTLPIWLPMQVSATTTSRGVHNYRTWARLAPGVTPAEAAADLTRIAADLEEEFTAENQNRGMWPQPVLESMVGNVRPALMVLLGAVGLVLLIACVNVANLLLARGQVREREIAIRSALGAGRRRLVRQLLTESVVLAGAGGALGVAIAVAGLRLVNTLGPNVLPRQTNVGLDLRVLGFTLVLTLATGALFGLLPALQTSGTDAQGSLREGTRGGTSSLARQRLRRALVVVEVAMAVALISGAGLLIKSFWRLNQVDPGFTAEGVLTMNIVLPASRYPQNRSDWPNYPEILAFQRDLSESVRAIPGVTAAAFAINAPTAGGWTTSFSIEGRPLPPERQAEEVRIRVANSAYFETVGIPIVRGRAPSARDDLHEQPPVALINEAMAERYFPDEDPIGMAVNQWGVPREIIGVVRDVKFMGLNEPVPPAVYPTFAHMPFGGFAFLVRTAGEPMDVLPQIRRRIAEIDPDLAVTGVSTLESLQSASISEPRFNMVLLGIFGGVALVLAAVGIYGVISYGVSQRTHEIGVRISLGARSADVQRQVVGQGLLLAGAGLVLGVGGALVVTRSMASLLFGVGTADPGTLVGVAVVVVVVAAAAAFVPARRASRIDPIAALRVE